MDKIETKISAPMLVNLGAAVPQEAVEKETPKGWVTLGEANLFSDYLIDLYYSSPVHSALTMSIAFMIAGKEFKSNNPAAQREIDRLKLNSIRRPITLDAKMQGGYYLEIIWSVDRTTVAKINHLPYENVRLAVANDEDVIPGIYYSKDWSDTRKKKNIPTFIPMYNPTTKADEPSQVLFVGVMTPGSAYYPKPDYYSAINYIEITREISEFYRAFLSNGMAPSYFLHMNNGIPDPEEQMAIRRNWETMMGAKKAGKVVFTFNESADRAPRLDLVPMSDADKQWMELSTQSRENILAAHRVTSPLLFGIRDAGGLGSNADEMKQAYRIFNKNIIEPYQQIVTDSLEEIFKGMGIVADIYIESNDLFSEEITTTTVAQTATTELSAEKKKTNLDPTEKPIFTDEDEAWWCEFLEDKGEIVDEEEWELIEAEPVNLASVRSYADPDKPSEMDSGLYKIRYAYSKNTSAKSRRFCRQMANAARAGFVYRYEDLQAMEPDTKELNPGLAQRGSTTYSVWLWKGGVNCKHAFERRVYFRKREKGRFIADNGLDSSNPISVAKAIRAGMPLKDIAKDFATANTRPFDMPDNGRVNPI
jgi:phage portal protein BeeE